MGLPGSSRIPFDPPPPRVGRTLAFALALLMVPFSAGGQESAYEQELNEILKDGRIQNALDRILANDAKGMEELTYLTEIPAPPFMEEERAEAFANLLREAGADSVRIDEVGNVLGFRAGRVGARTVVLGGHLDTVFPEGTDVTVHRRGDTLFAPGIGDDTRGLSVTISVLRALVEAEVTTDDNLLFLGSVGEEGLGDLRGVKHFFGEDGHGADAFIEVDGGGISSIVSMGLGSNRYRITFRGPGGHSWGAFGLVNPAHSLGRAIQRFSVFADSATLSGPRTSFNIGRIGGGTSINSIPFEAWMEVDIRSESPEQLEAVSMGLLRAVEAADKEENAFRRNGEALEVSVEKIGARPSGETDPSAPLVQRAMAVTRHFDQEPRLSRSSTNSNIPISLGIPAITIGRGGAGGANHSPDEWWLNRDGHLAVQRALLILVAEAGMSR